MIDDKKIRRLLKKTEKEFISIMKASDLLKSDIQSATETLTNLENLGFIERAMVEGYWQISVRGKLLANKKFDKEFKVATQKQHLKDLLERAAFVNTSPKFPHYISTIKITSSYPIEHQTTGVHIAYSLKRKVITEKKYNALAAKLRNEHKGSFGNHTEYYFYPHTAIHIFLKSGSHVLKLREYVEEEMKQIEGYLAFEVN